jgi:hypothetical protein
VMHRRQTIGTHRRRKRRLVRRLVLHDRAPLAVQAGAQRALSHRRLRLRAACR